MSPVAKLKSRMKVYLEHESPERAVLSSTLQALKDELPSTAIFGGMLREFALNRVRDFTSDIDLVTFASGSEILAAIKNLSPRKNRFGGYRFTASRWRFDIWPFEETWAFRQGLVRGARFEDLFKTTFFNLDAALFHLSTREFAFSPQYEQGIVDRLLEINLEANPSPARMARRAIRLAVERDLSIGPGLATFILSHTESSEFEGVFVAFVNGLRCHVLEESPDPYRFRPQQSMEL